ncbi:MAG: rRNA pseudouridine synthase [Candidatus Liberibacter ctenarytainae]|uniref:Pseudouridine synthase n=1 Tax=Candidatus Liberibacter ctenarytainae TaxID=2020335 RepID=A0A937AJG1_9HYPH|nr:rRNA pseudouridine synthase [Candidatus Liberibacter ctenarytainae]
MQENSPPERVSKVIARAGIASRREVERMIAQKRVKVNGVCLERAAVNVTASDYIEVDDQPLRKAERTRLWLYCKPTGLVTTHVDPEGRPTVFENLPVSIPRVISIGRLDINTEGLLLLTNDGGLARILELPSTNWLRVYRVRVYGNVDQSKIDSLKEGIVVQGICYREIQARIDSQKGSNFWLTVGLREGKNREIKKVFESLNWKVSRLIRISYGPFQLGELLEGDVREVSGKVLREQLGLKLLKEAKINFDMPIYSSQKLIQDNPCATIREIDKSAYISTEANNRKMDSADKKEHPFMQSNKKERPFMQRRNRSSNVWMASGIHAPLHDREESHNRRENGINAKKGKFFHKKGKNLLNKKINHKV